MRRAVCLLLFACVISACGSSGSSGSGSPIVPHAPNHSGGAGPILPAGHVYLGTNTFDQNFNYVSAALRVYNEGTGSPVATINLNLPPSTGPTSVSVSADGKWVYVTAGVLVDLTTCELMPALTIIDATTNTIVSQTQTASSLYGGTLGPDQTHVYGVGKGPGGMSLFLFNATSGALEKTIVLPSSSSLPKRVAVTHDGNTAFVMDENSHAIYKVDVTAGTASTFFQGASNVAWDNVALNASDTKLFLGTEFKTFVFNPSTGTQTGSIGLAPGTTINYDQSGSADGSTLLSANDNNEGTVIDTVSSSERTVPSGFGATADAINANASLGLFWQLSFSGLPVTAVDLTSGSQLYTIPLPSNVIVYSAAAN